MNKYLDSPHCAYIHIPFCRRRCYYCDFPISVLGNKTDINTSGMIKNYLEVLCREIRVTPSLGYPLDTIFFGGGTPSLLPVSALERILDILEQKFGINPEVEISMEMDPGTFTPQQLQGYLKAGVNRVSLGVQAFQDQLLQTCGRSHTSADIFTAIAQIREMGVNNLSIDLISGLPHQTLEQWENSLEQAIKLVPNHISCYDLVLEPVTAFGKRYQPGETPLPTDETTAQMYRLAQSKLTQAGYTHYEISNYAQNGYQCRHNRVYWENRSYYGFGMGATSYINKQRFTRPKTRQDYANWVEHLNHSGGIIDYPTTSQKDQLLETLMLGLRLAQGVNLSYVTNQYGQKILQYIGEGLQHYYRQGWVEGIDRDGKPLPLDKITDLLPIETIKLTDPEGFLFSNTILATLFERINRIETLTH